MIDCIAMKKANLRLILFLICTFLLISFCESSRSSILKTLLHQVFERNNTSNVYQSNSDSHSTTPNVYSSSELFKVIKNSTRTRRVKTQIERRVVKRSCLRSTASVSEERDKAGIVLTGRVEGVMYSTFETDKDGSVFQRKKRNPLDDIISNNKQSGAFSHSSIPIDLNKKERVNQNAPPSLAYGDWKDSKADYDFVEKSYAKGLLGRENFAAARIRVKRVIKGDRALENTLVVVVVVQLDDAISIKSKSSGGGESLSELDSSEKGDAHTFVTSRRFCMGRLRIRDTRIFMLGIDPYGRLVLLSNPLPLTLHNLRQLDSHSKQTYAVAVAPPINLTESPLPVPFLKPHQLSTKEIIPAQPNKPYSSSVQEEPCEQTKCALGESCFVEGGRPTCRCQESCSSEYSPVCGSDRVTYSNQCLLHMSACIHQNSVRIKHSGECDKPDPCAEKICPFGSRCLSSVDGHYATCECPESCPNYGDSDDSQPVCGSDGRFYRNRCELDRQACHMGRNITVKYIGKCDPCEELECSAPQVCHLDDERKASCQCGEVCSMNFNPVCSSDGKTYPNECIMRQEACISRRDLRIIYRGKCSSGVNPCESRTCQGYETCGINRFGIAQCTCSAVCDPVFRPVCGTDGRTYDNECQLSLTACREAKKITIAFKGTCEEGSVCAKHGCRFGEVCSEKNGHPVCECPVCPSDYDPVCGSDVVSYQNECRVRLEACAKNVTITVIYNGLCNLFRDFMRNANDGCDNKQCDFYSICESDLIETKCVCPQDCIQYGDSTLNNSPVCGTDGKMYESECDLKKSACQQQKFIVVASIGFCDLCENVQCKFGARCEKGMCICPKDCPVTRDPVCGSDFVTYTNECELQKTACHLNRSVKIHFYGECNPPSTIPFSPGSVSRTWRNGLKESSFPIAIPIGETVRPFSPSSSKSSRLNSTPDSTFDELLTTSQPPLPYTSEASFSNASFSFCESSLFGCCPDGFTSALGPDNAGCPSMCGCNKFGSIRETCDPETGECDCHPGVGGHKCDRCLPGFWGLPRNVAQGHRGCSTCDCSKFGSVRDDCEQMTGGCVCKPEVSGLKCDSCNEGEFLGPYGCTNDPTNLGTSCDELVCSYGAECEQDGKRAGCVCNIFCDMNGDEEVCANDGFTYESGCLIQLQSCREQKQIWIIHKGSCPGSSESDGTENPIRRWSGTGYYDSLNRGFSDISKSEMLRESFGSSGMKSTRHLPPQSIKYQDNFLRNFYNHRSATSATIQVRSYLGDSCLETSDCITTQSICFNSLCTCKEGYYEDRDKIQCNPIHSHNSGDKICSQASGLCGPEASCYDHRNGSFSCVCPMGKALPGDNCQNEESPSPFLSGRSTVKLGKLAGYHKLSLELEITPFLNYSHGVLVFSSQHANGSGDFFSLALIDGYVELRYDLGDGAAILRSSSRVISGSNYHIMAKRYNRDGLLRVDREEDVKGTSPGAMKSLNLDQGGYLGFVPLNSTQIWESVGTSEGFIGCIHKLKVGRRPIEFQEEDPLILSFDKVYQCPTFNPTNRIPNTHHYILPTQEREMEVEVEQKVIESRKEHREQTHPTEKLFFNNERNTFETEESKLDEDEISNGIIINNNNNIPFNPEEMIIMPVKNYCANNPCQNNGICWNDRGNQKGFKCACHPEFDGVNCESRSNEIKETGAMLDFRGFSELELPTIENGARYVSIEMWMMVRALDGLILYNGQEMGKGDFVTLLINNGHIQFLFDLGSGIANLTWSNQITLNKWHWIVASREGREGKLQIDGQTPQTVKSPPTLSELNLELPMYIGGVSDMNIVHRELGILSPFDGVLQYIRVNNETYHREISSALKDRLVHRYEGPPCGSSVSPPCANGGTCFPRLDSFVCLCPAQFSGKSCENRKEVPGPVRFDGQSYLKFPRKVSKHESFNFSDYDDFYNDNFDSQLDEWFGGFEGDENNNDGSEATEDGETFWDEDFVYEDDQELILIVEHDFVERVKAQRRNRLEIVFRTSNQDTPGALLWTGRNPRGGNEMRKGYLGVFIVDGYPELRVHLGAKNKSPVVIKSKVKVSDGRWHQLLIARRRRLIVLQVDGSAPQRVTAPAGSNVLVSDGRFWIGGVAGSVLPGDIPPGYHQGFVGCVDLVRVEKRRLPLSKIAYSNGLPLCEDD